MIAPAGATQISLNFTAFDTEDTYDVVNVYDGPDDTYPLLATWYGNTLPPTIKTSEGVGAMCVTEQKEILQRGIVGASLKPPRGILIIGNKPIHH